MSQPIPNRVAESGLITLDLENYYPGEEIAVFDLKPYLFMGQVLKEKDFRKSLQELDWESYAGKTVALTCSADAIVPSWAFMLVASYLQPVSKEIIWGNEAEARETLLLRNIRAMDGNEFSGKRVVVKGCGNIEIGAAAYLEITKKLRPVVKNLSYGEPCSTVPLYKKKMDEKNE